MKNKKMRPDDIKSVDSDTWADYCADYRTTASEKDYSLSGMSTGYINSMVLRHSETKELIGMVDYYDTGRREYFIFLNRFSPKIERN